MLKNLHHPRIGIKNVSNLKSRFINPKYQFGLRELFTELVNQKRKTENYLKGYLKPTKNIF